MEVLNSLKGRPSLIDVRDQAALESALYHLPTVFAEAGARSGGEAQHGSRSAW